MKIQREQDVTEERLQHLLSFLDTYKRAATLEEKKDLLLGRVDVKEGLADPAIKEKCPKILSEEIVFLTLLALDEDEVIAAEGNFEDLAKVDLFYEPIGGLLGYYVTFLQLLTKTAYEEKKSYASPPYFDVSKKTNEVKSVVRVGVEALSEMAEIYPIGGLGDRLNLRGPQDEPLPAATLLFCGRTLLEGLVRDVSAREYLYYKLFSKEIFVPIAMMTSHEKQNDRLILEICEKNHWFGRPQSTFCLFCQISVPVITEEGHFLIQSEDGMHLQPGGHGALWRTAEEKGVFQWLESLQKKRVLIRQINNPIAGLDDGLLSLVGKGVQDNKIFGFASCKRAPNAAEGVLVALKDEQGDVTISNIEYTDFKRHGIEDLEDEEGNSFYPANTNILYVHIPSLRPYLRKDPLPGVVLNMKSTFAKPTGESIKGGRLESTMQSISDSLASKDLEHIPSYLTYNERLKTISTTKRSFDEGKSLLETPVGAFYDLMQNAHDLLKNSCHAQVVPLNTAEDYLLQGPSLLFLYHPALGPLYEVIAQKIKGGVFHKNAELQLEIAEIYVENLDLDGSLFVEAKNVLGATSEGICHYGLETGKCTFKNVKVKNRGIDRGKPSLYWKNAHRHHERLQITLEGCSEFHAEDVTFEGDIQISVPHLERWTAFVEEGKIAFRKEKLTGPTWHWDYQLEGDAIVLKERYSVSHHTIS